ncbi:DUF222 domain-containing protein [Nocardioides sp. KIGAM211]|uniref:DUF222 domain-containing protein n=1 Tax=Nocardioides luti TaxID=2761101 RepID=A0A7X0RCX9_9ACTN|nr:HNH endonuclease signature motif containing protein [Nocardioides luti]MBB6625983.1 DUF222 domain-containing protein [Nocardioides luti]
MFEPASAPPSPGPAPSVAELARLLDGLSQVRVDSERDGIDQLEALERVKSACAAAQARITADLDVRRAARSTAARMSGSAPLPGHRDPHSAAGLASAVALARRESPHRGRRHLALAVALGDLPETLAALERGDLSEEAALVVAEETQDLALTDRRHADGLLADRCDDPWEGLGLDELRRCVRGIAQECDEDAVRRRRARALRGRRVTGRLLRDGTAQISAVVADWQLAAVQSSLAEAADRARAAGDDRTRGQVMADTFVARLTNQVTAVATPVAVGIVISAEALLGDDDSPAHVDGVGPVPASIARRLVAASPDVRSTVRRLFACPETGSLLAMDSRARRFPAGLRDFVRIRDQFCRTPWCDAPVRHTDHPRPRRRGGPTDRVNSQGLCEACNYAKEAAGWRHRTVSEPHEQHTVEITTPTGHVHRSRAPAQPMPTSGGRLPAVRIRDLASA